ncbi:MAG: extracellular solute-binding protein [Blautia sp.]|nr:extracellular solute-binding protein [Blautia sp.]
MYPDVNIEYEGITDYSNDVTMRLSTGDWGDICMVPTTIDKDELPNFFVSFGDKESLSQIYESNMLNNYAFDNQVCGIPSMANVQGIVYNKKVFDAAGVAELPKTPDEFLDALQKIKDNTDAIPLYTNFAAGWTMGAWHAYIDGGATGDPDFVNEGLLKGENPFSDRGDGTGPYAVYNILYEAVSRGLTEDDPTTTDWEGSKGMLNRGEIGQ